MADLTLTDALAALARTGTIVELRSWHPDLVRFFRAVRDDGYQPDLTSPQDVGCLLALLREATCNPYLHAVPVAEDFEELPPEKQAASGRPEWLVDGHGLAAGYIGNIEGEALAAALVALAQEVPRG